MVGLEPQSRAVAFKASLLGSAAIALMFRTPRKAPTHRRSPMIGQRVRVDCPTNPELNGWHEVVDGVVTIPSPETDAGAIDLRVTGNFERLMVS